VSPITLTQPPVASHSVGSGGTFGMSDSAKSYLLKPQLTLNRMSREPSLHRGVVGLWEGAAPTAGESARFRCDSVSSRAHVLCDVESWSVSDWERWAELIPGGRSGQSSLWSS